jgi:hypothetical protein
MSSQAKGKTVRSMRQTRCGNMPGVVQLVAGPTVIDVCVGSMARTKGKTVRAMLQTRCGKMPGIVQLVAGPTLIDVCGGSMARAKVVRV